MASLKAFISDATTKLSTIGLFPGYIKGITGLASEATPPYVTLQETATALKAITGKSSPTTSPDVSLVAVNSHMNASNPHSGTQAALGFTPVEQGGGSGQTGIKLYMGWSGDKIKVQVGTSDQGNLAMESWVSYNYATSYAPNFTGPVNFSGVVAFNSWVGFYGAPVVGKQTINGTVTSSVPNTNGAAIGRILDVLEAYGLINDYTTRN